MGWYAVKRATPPGWLMKRCCSCQTDKSLDCFGKNRSTKDGLQKQCKACRSEHATTRYSAKATARAVAWSRANPDKTKANKRAYYYRHPEKRYDKTHPERSLLLRYMYRTRLRQATPEWAKSCLIERARVEAIYQWCRKLSWETGVKHHVDHIVPIVAGGLNVSSNLQILTAEDNLKKGSIHNGIRFRRKIKDS